MATGGVSRGNFTTKAQRHNTPPISAKPENRCRVGPVEEVVKFRPELHRDRFTYPGLLGQREIEIVQTRCDQGVASHGAAGRMKCCQAAVQVGFVVIADAAVVVVKGAQPCSLLRNRAGINHKNERRIQKAGKPGRARPSLVK
jgi:hypothetical protein